MENPEENKKIQSELVVPTANFLPNENKKGENLEKKTKRAPNVPKSNVELAELCVRVAESWRDKHPNFSVDYIDYNQMLSLGNQLLQAAEENLAVTDDKKTNTISLETINKEINNSAKFLRKYIQDEYSELSDLSDYYQKYGLIKMSNGSYQFSGKNVLRLQGLNKLVDKLSEPNNPFAGRKRGLAYWQNLRDAHATAWDDSQDLKQNKSELSQTAGDLNVEIDFLLRRFLTSVKGAFYGKNFVKARRSFGFLRENF
jgi:hypothetical protein